MLCQPNDRHYAQSHSMQDVSEKLRRMRDFIARPLTKRQGRWWPMVPFIPPYLGQTKPYRAQPFVMARDISYLTMDTLYKDITSEMRPKSPEQCLTSVRFVTQKPRL